ncbi:aminotransferase class I/II-fold pyridoxal phosphate-dependent enzyme [Shimia sp. R10_1]|uniref:DegT/DnrJ/EryC1/StrS family aminotransferase n=1 Tax=Shimia sp. R10_1 TaxID=2821095 RepID=UPI001ADCA4DF|nr:aminotransferase class I/II-fold pyridoxal phosphate-dependent enzyme [Shimia sp. R10_1]MBO9473635.1 aminotransferase class I/II-fold pyridoxal phosphate-dependent enzyme [Shimia sp. R10_1]
MSEVFKGNFTQQEPISEEAIAAAVDVMRTGRLHRYNLSEGEVGEASLLEQEFAQSVGAKFCIAVASGGYAMGCALRAMGVGAGDKVLTNAFTLAPVPGAIASVGAVPVFVGVTEGLVIDLDDLETKADQADVLMLSHMRGHICDMDALMAICAQHNIRVIEDCAHTMGGSWRGVPSGRFGQMACYSTQTYKHMNSGEGGLLISDDAELMARATILSGSYMLYGRNGAVPEAEVFERVKYDTPNVSGRMDHLRAAILRPQLRKLSDSVAAWNARHDVILDGLRETPGLTVVERPEGEGYVGSSIQFLLLDWSVDKINAVLKRCLARGVELKWFGGAEPVAFTSRYDSWRYAPSAPMPKSDRILKGIVDMRIPLTFSLEDCALIARIIKAEVGAVFQSG